MEPLCDKNFILSALKYSTTAGLSKEAHKALRKYSLTGQNTDNFSEWKIINKKFTLNALNLRIL